MAAPLVSAAVKGGKALGALKAAGSLTPDDGEGGGGSRLLLLVLVAVVVLPVAMLFSFVCLAAGAVAVVSMGDTGSSFSSGSATIVGDKAMPVAAGTRAFTYAGHAGVDLQGACGAPIYAVFDGTVTWEGVESYGAHVVFLRHADGTLVQYAHMPYGWPGVMVKTGEKVKAGQQIGVIGSSGISSGCHLHFEVVLGTKPGTTQVWRSRTRPFAWLLRNGIAPVSQICGPSGCGGDENQYSGWFVN